MANDNKERYLSLIGQIQRKQKRNLLSYLEKSDFFEAPESINGGSLLDHSLAVYDTLSRKAMGTVWNDKLSVSQDTLLIVGLLSNICFTRYFEKQADGTIVVNDKNPMGKGEKSVWMLSSFFDLTMQEALAIRWFKENEGNATFCDAAKLEPLVLMMHEAESEVSLLCR